MAVRSRLEAIHALNAVTNAYTHVLPTTTRLEPESKLVSVKANIATTASELPTTAGSALLSEYVSPYAASAVERVEEGGYVVVGKTNCDEFGMGSHSSYSASGGVISPWGPTLSPGGSSGGAAVSVALPPAQGGVDLALGSDTGGSVRLPASYNGVVGLKPTYGLVPRTGLLAYASSMDCIGLLAPTVAAAGEGLKLIAGPDGKDPSARAPPKDWDPLPGGTSPRGVDGLRVGMVRDALVEELDPDMERAWRNGARVLEEAGAAVSWVDLPAMASSIGAYYIIAAAEASSNLARYDGIRYGQRGEAEAEMGEKGFQAAVVAARQAGFGPEVKKRIMLGTHVLSASAYAAYYQAAVAVRNELKAELASVLASTVDVLLLPTALGPPPRMDESQDPLASYINDVFTVPANLAGLPALSVPAGTSGSALPLGLQLMGREFGEADLLSAAEVVERSCRSSQGRVMPESWSDV